MSKRKNPNRTPLSRADYNKAFSCATENCWAIFFSVLTDKENFHGEDLRRVWSEANYLSESVLKKRVSIDDLKRTLAEEEGVDLV